MFSYHPRSRGGLLSRTDPAPLPRSRKLVKPAINSLQTLSINCLSPPFTHSLGGYTDCKYLTPHGNGVRGRFFSPRGEPSCKCTKASGRSAKREISNFPQSASSWERELGKHQLPLENVAEVGGRMHSD